jgi:hypothetical protein
MEYDPTSQDYLLDDHDRKMLQIDADRVPLSDRSILLKADIDMHQRAQHALEQASGDALREAHVQRDLDYCNIYSRNLLNIIHRSTRPQRNQ